VPYEFGASGESSPYLNGDFVHTLPKKEVEERIAKSRARQNEHAKVKSFL
jgi:hypothetical protein